ncbi:MAG TPA: nuclear transport factor 2 family protein [Thermoanaerobaculia bacterium]
MHANAALIERFYRAFGARDADGVVACYHPDVQFSDPVFPDLRGDRARAMWRLLILRGKDLRVEARDFVADDATGSAHWDAWYTFSATGRPVHNSIDARFTFRDGLIHTHRDTFDLWRWAAQALGAKGSLLGWSGFVQGAIRKQAARALDDFVAKQG